MPLKNGEVFAGYVIQRFIGAGAMGEVYLVQHPRLPRMDALKVLPSALTANAEYRFRFNREADLASTLWHSNIVGVHDRGEFDGQLWISMDYVDGTDAQHLIEESYPTGMPMHEVLEIVTAVADALDVAHQRGLLHRDVKPSNILLAKAQGSRRRILLADFGIARQTDEVSGLTGTNMTVGSVGYAAPEQLLGERLDGRADQYGLAATAFHLLTGARPFRDSNPAVVISKQLTTPAPMLSERRSDLANLDRVLSAALAKEPNGRYPHCLDFADALSRAGRQHYARGTVAPADATRLMSTPSAPASPETQSDAAETATPKPDGTRAVSVPPASDPPSAPRSPTRHVGIAPPAADEPEPPDGADADREQSSDPPGPPAQERENLLADPQWADALSAYFAERWTDAVERFETLRASYPGEARVETRLKEALRQRDIGLWSGKAEASAAKADWDTVVTALEKLIGLDPANRNAGARLEQARMAQRRKALVDEMTALHQAGRWDAVVAAARELARIDPDNSDPGGIVSAAQAKIREAQLPDRYAQALNHLDQEQWQQAADLLATVEQEHPGYRDAAALLKTAQQKLRGTAEFRQRPVPPPRPLPQTTTPAPPSTPTPPVPVALKRRWQTRGWFVAVSIVAIGVALTLFAVVQNSKSSNTSTSTSTSRAAASVRPTFEPPSGPNETIANYIKNNHIHATTITHGTLGAPVIDLPVPGGWIRIPDSPDAQYFGIVFNAPTNPDDPPMITARLKKLTGSVDTGKLLAVAAGEVKNLPGYSGGDCELTTLSGNPACQVGGPYTKKGVARVAAQKTVVIQREDGVYLLQVNAEGLQADTAALNAAAGVIDEKTTISA
jgi:serine/threonine protein kinase